MKMTAARITPFRNLPMAMNRLFPNLSAILPKKYLEDVARDALHGVEDAELVHCRSNSDGEELYEAVVELVGEDLEAAS